MTPPALTTTDRVLTTTDVMTAFGALLRLYVADGDASPETILSYYGKAAQFVVWCGEHGIRCFHAILWLAGRSPTPAP